MYPKLKLVVKACCGGEDNLVSPILKCRCKRLRKLYVIKGVRLTEE